MPASVRTLTRVPHGPQFPHARRRSVAFASIVFAGTAVALLGWAQRAHAQVLAVDEGSFAVTRAGVPVGREQFRILRQPGGGGAGFVARAVGAYGARRITPALQADSEGEPLRYQIDVRGAGADERVSAQGGAAGHFSAQLQHGEREGAREYLLAAGTVVADDDAYHQLYFLARRALAGATSVPVLVPRTDTQLSVSITRVGAGPITIGGRAIPATHYLLADARTGWCRELWVDVDGRVLRVVNAALGIDALREDPPR